MHFYVTCSKTNGTEVDERESEGSTVQESIDILILMDQIHITQLLKGGDTFICSG